MLIFKRSGTSKRTNPTYKVQESIPESDLELDKNMEKVGNLLKRLHTHTPMEEAQLRKMVKITNKIHEESQF